MSIEADLREAALLNCVDDSTLMKAPRHAPVHQGFAVGDAAVMLLSESTEVAIEDVLPEEVQADWAQQGIYAYFRYVSVDPNRRDFKRRWVNPLRSRSRE